jgi:Skp family chaperone for outer membrane proteins
MRYLLMLALAAAAPLPLARAQDAAPLPVALVNMDRIFGKYQPFQDKLAPVREAAAELNKKIQLRQSELETVVNKLRASQPGTPESQRLQQQAARLQAELQQFVQKERDELQKQESKLLLELYRQVEEEVRKYAKARKIKLVIRQQESSLDDNQSLQDILKSLNRGIIFEDGLDITDDIIKALDARIQSETKKER